MTNPTAPSTPGLIESPHGDLSVMPDHGGLSLGGMHVLEGDLLIMMGKFKDGLRDDLYGRAFLANGSGFGANPKLSGRAIFGRWLDETEPGRVDRGKVRFASAAERELLAEIIEALEPVNF